MPQPSKMVVDREKSSTKVQAAGETHLPRIIKLFNEQYGPEVGDHAGKVVSAVLHKLKERTQAMKTADQRHADELGDDPAARDERDAAATDLLSTLVNTRSKLAPLCGEPYVRQLGFDGALPDDPRMIKEIAARVRENLIKLPVPAVQVPDYVFKPRSWADPLTAKVDRLDRALAVVAREEKEADASIQDKRTATNEYDRTFSQAANLVSVLLETVGEVELARRVRPSTRKPGQTVEVAAETQDIMD